jgi:hypothetical protein
MKRRQVPDSDEPPVLVIKTVPAKKTQEFWELLRSPFI